MARARPAAGVWRGVGARARLCRRSAPTRAHGVACDGTNAPQVPQVAAARGEACCWGLQGGGHETLAPAGARGGLSFAERVWATPQGSALGALEQRVGYDAGDDVAWEVDLSGTAVELGGEERELVLMAGWVRTGQWRAALDTGALEASEAPGAAPDMRLIRLPGGSLVGELTLSRSDGLPTSLRLATAAGLERWTFAGPWHRASDDGAVVAPASHKHFPAAGGESVYTIAAEGVALEAEGCDSEASPFAVDFAAVTAQRTVVDAEAPARVPCCRGDGGHVLARARAANSSGGKNSKGADAEVPGWMVIDTASGGALCISPAAADELGMERFGEVWLNGVGGGLRCALRRCEAIALGQVTLVRPVFIEMELGDAVRPASVARGRRAGLFGNDSNAERKDRIVGAVGGALLRRGVLELRLGKRDPWKPGAPAMALSVCAPGAYQAPSKRADAAWQGLRYEYGVPHLEAVLSYHEVRPEDEAAEGEGEGEGEIEPVLLKLSLGVGGCGLILKRQAATRAGVETAVEVGGVVSGAGSERARMGRIGQPLPDERKGEDAPPPPRGAGDEDVFATRLAAVEFKGATMRGVRTLVHKGEVPQDLELAKAAGGAACAQLIDGGNLLCLDVPNDRVSISKLDEYT